MTKLLSTVITVSMLHYYTAVHLDYNYITMFAVTTESCKYLLHIQVDGLINRTDAEINTATSEEKKTPNALSCERLNFSCTVYTLWQITHFPKENKTSLI